MSTVSGLNLRLNAGTDNEYLATWSCGQPQVTVTTGQTKPKGSKTWKYTRVTVSGSAQVSGYTVRWEYYNPNGELILSGDDTTTTNTQSTYSPPSNATKVRVSVLQNSNSYTYTKIYYKKKKKKTETSSNAYFTAEWAATECVVAGYDDPDTPSTPSISLDGSTLTCTITGITDDNTYSLQFQVVKDDVTQYAIGTQTRDTEIENVVWTTTLPSDGGKYKVRARAANKGGDWSEWSSYSSEVQSKPEQITEAPTLKTTSSSSVLVTWNGVDNVDHYTIGYANSEGDLKRQDNTYSSKDTSTSTTSYTLTGLTSGNIYYVVVRGVASGGSTGEWSPSASTAVGTTPEAPTTWSSVSVASIGDVVKLYWVHNSEDNSIETYANLVITVDDLTKINETIANTAQDEYGNATNETNVYELDTSQFNDSDELIWKVATKGVLDNYGEWSVSRSIKVYEQPSVVLNLANTESDLSNPDVILSELTSFPLYIKATISPATQSSVGYLVTITANSGYTGENANGDEVLITAGSSIYSKYFLTTGTYTNATVTDNYILLKLSAGDVDFEPFISYTISVDVTTNAGLSATQSASFTVNWTDITYIPNAYVNINTDNFSAQIEPYCYDTVNIASYSVALDDTKEYLQLNVGYYESFSGIAWIMFDGDTPDVKYSGFIVSFTDDNDDIQLTFSTTDSPTTATTLSFEEGVIYSFDLNLNYAVYQGLADESEHGAPVTFGVYRRESTGNLIEIATGIENVSDITSRIAVYDPHPSLNSVTYRIAATDISTGAVGFTDVTCPVGESSIIIQWDEEPALTSTTDLTSDPDYYVEDTSGWSGTTLILPYNIDVSETYSVDSEAVEYIGRSRPVSYYGTQLGESPSWSTDIDKTDTETIGLLRQLAAYKGDAYVREPSGTGYWATVKVSFKQTHANPIVPVTLSITPVEGNGI